MNRITLETIMGSINEVKTSVDNLEIRLKEHVSNEVGGLAYMVYKVEERLIDRMDGFELRMDSFETKLEGLDKRVGCVENKLTELDQKVDNMHYDMDNRFDGVYEHFHKLEIGKIDRIRSVV
jgi:archaellum component FlaC